MPSLEHPSHSVPDEIIVSMRRLREADLATQARQDEIAQLARPNKEERRQIAEIRESAAQARGINADMLRKLRDISARKSRRVLEKFREEAIRMPIEHPPWDSNPPQPVPTDPNFWWARTDASHSERTPPAPDEGSAAHFNAGFGKDGLQFNGGVTTHDGDLYKDHFGAVALFELQADRIPPSPSHRWRSTPHVELFGGLLGYTGDDDISTGDLWSKCWMHRDQKLFQLGFGPDGPVPIVLGEAHESEPPLIFEEDGDRSVHVALPGFLWMPPVTFDKINLANSLFARVEVRFDIQTEGAGTHLWLDPMVLLRTFQWPLTPL